MGAGSIGGMGAEPASRDWGASPQRWSGGRAPSLIHSTTFPLFSDFNFNCFVTLLECLEPFEPNLGYFFEIPSLKDLILGL